MVIRNAFYTFFTASMFLLELLTLGSFTGSVPWLPLMFTIGLPPVLFAALFFAYKLVPTTLEAVVVVLPRIVDPVVAELVVLVTVVVLLF